MNLPEEWKTRSRERKPKSGFTSLTPCYATELEQNPMFWSQASHSLYDSNLGRTWASESIISGLRFIFLVWKKKRDYRNDYFIVNAKLQHIKN